jgi:GcrA cell cycle regulator
MKRLGMCETLAERNHRPKVPKAKRHQPYKPRPKHLAPKPEPEAIAIRCAEVVSRNVGLLELGPCDCRYPYGDGCEGSPYLFCGNRQDDNSSYCPAHLDLTRGYMR